MNVFWSPAGLAAAAAAVDVHDLDAAATVTAGEPDVAAEAEAGL
jgi:hypothetical protein